jgi:hypothetical protein
VGIAEDKAVADVDVLDVVVVVALLVPNRAAVAREVMLEPLVPGKLVTP